MTIPKKILSVGITEFSLVSLYDIQQQAGLPEVGLPGNTVYLEVNSQSPANPASFGRDAETILPSS